jgi:hypothetical protein
MQTNQTILCVEGCSLPTVYTETAFNSRGKPKNGRGRTPTYLTREELEVALKYYFSSSLTVKQQVLQSFGKKKITRALAICKLDLGKQGRIGRYVCSFHGAKYLVYSWCGSEDGVRIRCFAPGGCSTNTHMDGYLYTGKEHQFEDADELISE